MNPFKGTLDRLGFLIWTLLLIPAYLFVLLAGIANDSSSLVSEIVVFLILGLLMLFTLLVATKRLQNAGLNKWLALLLLLFPYAWPVLFFIPTSSKVVSPSTVPRPPASI